MGRWVGSKGRWVGGEFSRPGRLAWFAVVPSTPSMSLTKSPVYLVTVVVAVLAHP